MSSDTDKLKGKVKETAGAATDNDKLRNEGKADQAAGNVKEKLGDAVDAVSDKLKGK